MNLTRQEYDADVAYRKERNASIVQTVIDHPEMPYLAIAETYVVSEQLVAKLARQAGILRRPGRPRKMKTAEAK